MTHPGHRGLVLETATLLLLLVLGLPCGALADDLQPPAWRGQAQTTFQEWEFTTSSNTPAADLARNPFGTPALLAQPGPGKTWLANSYGQQGVWPLSGSLTITLPDRPRPEVYSDVWVQLTWAEEIPGGFPSIWLATCGSLFTMIYATIPDPGPIWKHSTYELLVSSSALFDTIKVTGGILVNELVIDTISVPEPSTSALLLLGAAVWYLRRKRGRD